MEATDLTIQVLKDIRDGISELRVELKAELGETNQRLDQTNQRIDETNRRLVASEVRVATAITDLHGTVRELTDSLRAQNDLRPRVERCEKEIASLKDRVELR